MKIAKQVQRALYEARKRNLPADVDLPGWMATVEDFERKCVYCDADYWSIDHFISLAQGGPSTIDNGVPCCERCNRLKASDDPARFRYQGRFSYEQIRTYLEQRKHGKRIAPRALAQRARGPEEDATRPTLDPSFPESIPAQRGQIIILHQAEHIILQVTSQSETHDAPSFTMDVPLTQDQCVMLAADLLQAVTRHPHIGGVMPEG